MTAVEQNNDEISIQNISYYNEIASDYDSILEKDSANDVIRAKVADYFSACIEGGNILDLGAGTGKDLAWLIKKNYHIFFCEPSKGMQQVVVERRKDLITKGDITFLHDTETDFRKWDSIKPFTTKIDAVLANFAVINCIPDIELLFDKLAVIVKPGGSIIALILHYSMKKKMRSNFKSAILSLFSGDPVHINVTHNGHSQQVYVHSLRSIKKASKGNFGFYHVEHLDGHEFTLINLVRK